MAGITEMSGAKTEKDGHRTTVATLVLQEVGPVFWTHRCRSPTNTTSAQQLSWIVIGIATLCSCTDVLTTKVRLLALVALVEGASMHGVLERLSKVVVSWVINAAV